MRKPLCIDLFCGMFGWGRAFAAEGWRVVGFDIEHLTHHGPVPEGCELVLQDVLTLHGSQFKDADCIVASPPCQKYSWLAMPWSRSKSNNSQKAKALRAQWEAEGPDNRLFEACFRIQREASEAAGRYIPLVVENVRGAQEWVGAAFYGLDAWKPATSEERWRMGRSAWNFGSFHLWGDVPALMPINLKGGLKRPGQSIKAGFNNWPKDANGNYIMPDGTSFTEGRKNDGGSWFNVAHNTESGTGRNPVNGDTPEARGQKTQGGSWFRERNGIPQPGIRHEDRGLKGIETDRQTLDNGTGGSSWFFGGKRADPRDVRRDESGSYVLPDGTKIGGDRFSDPTSTCRKHGSRSSARKAASALIAKIPEALASHIARVYKPRECAA